MGDCIAPGRWPSNSRRDGRARCPIGAPRKGARSQHGRPTRCTRSGAWRGCTGPTPESSYYLIEGRRTPTGAVTAWGVDQGPGGGSTSCRRAVGAFRKLPARGYARPCTLAFHDLHWAPHGDAAVSDGSSQAVLVSWHLSGVRDRAARFRRSRGGRGRRQRRRPSSGGGSRGGPRDEAPRRQGAATASSGCCPRTRCRLG